MTNTPDAAFIVTVDNGGFSYWLRGTTWTMTADRAQPFPDRDAAAAGLLKAKMFMKPTLFRKARIEAAA